MLSEVVFFPTIHVAKQEREDDKQRHDDKQQHECDRWGGNACLKVDSIVRSCVPGFASGGRDREIGKRERERERF